MPAGRPSRHAIFTQLDAAVSRLDAQLGGLPSPEQMEGIWSDIWHLETHHSTALEGNTLIQRHVSALLADGRTLGTRPLKDYVEVSGYARAAEWVYQHAWAAPNKPARPSVTLREVREMHVLAMTPVWDVAPHEGATDREGPGNFREHDLYPFSSGMNPPSWVLVPSAITDWLERTDELAHELMADPRQASRVMPAFAEIHAHFERVHPFIDGNGRVGRLILNLQLVRMGYPPAVILKSQRPRYLAGLRAADRGDTGPLAELLARAVHHNINRFIVPSLAHDDVLVPLSALVDADFSLAALRQAAQRGRLTAVLSPEGTWMSSREHVDAYRRVKGKHLRPRSRRDP